MANARSSNTFRVDTVSNSGTANSWVDSTGTKLRGILFTSAAAADSITVNDLSASSVAAGAVKFTVTNLNATDTKFINLQECPIVFPNGVWISALSASSTATLILETSG